MPPPSAGSPAPPATGEPSWLEVEPPSGTGWAAIGRLRRRSRGSWKIWVSAALVISVLATIRSAGRPPGYTVSIVVRVLESTVQPGGADFGVAALRSYVNDLVFTNANLIAVMKRHPETFRGLDKNPSFELEDLRKAIDVSVTENDFVQERDPNDPPRTARIVFSYTSFQPELAFNLATELVELIIGTTEARQREELARERAATESAMRRAEAGLTGPGRGPGAAGQPSSRGPDHRRDAARWRLQAAGSEATAARLAMRAAEVRQGLRFEVVDPGRVPPTAGSGRLVTDFLVTLGITLMAGWLLAGAFDPRVLDAGDLETVGFPPLGRLPAPPGTRAGGRRAPPAEKGSENDTGKGGEGGTGRAREITGPRV
jgi:hypothetical protein